MHRREFLKKNTLAGATLVSTTLAALSQSAGERPTGIADVHVLNPRARVPVSFIIDDSTCLVNLNKFAIPQFAAAWGEDSAYQKYDWRAWPDEIPDDFVRTFGDWCGENGVKGKYSIVPYPACVGRLDRELPGWSAKELAASLDLVRTRLLSNWDIHPEMVTHTRIIDITTGHPFPERNLKFMENWEWTTGRSAEEIADYLRYALNILKNVGLPCEGITTPGGFGNRALPQLAMATLQSVRDVFGAEIPHYFRHLYSQGTESVAPRVEYASGLDSENPRCVVSIIGCTGDWTGGWDNSPPGGVDRFITENGQRGRMVEVIERGEPACLLAHWTGIWFNGEETGFNIFKEMVKRLHARFDHLVWMKLSEIARYWAARELTRIGRAGNAISLHAPFAAPVFTVRLPRRDKSRFVVASAEHQDQLREVSHLTDLVAGSWCRDGVSAVLCFNLAKGRSTIQGLPAS
jgi:hypothetical protein